MNEIYWITRLGAIDGALTVVLVLACIALVTTLVFGFGLSDWEFEDLPITRSSLFKVAKCSFAVFVIAGAIDIFTPTKKELLLIYGVGSVVDYVQQSDEAKKLPDNAIKAINQWLTEEDESSKKDK